MLFKLCSVIGLNNLLAAYEDKSAEAVCTFAYGSGNPRDPILLFKGITPASSNLIPPLLAPHVLLCVLIHTCTNTYVGTFIVPTPVFLI